MLGFVKSVRQQTVALPAAPRVPLGRPLLQFGAAVAFILVLLVVGYRFGAGSPFTGQVGTISASDAATCFRADCDVHFTAILVTRQYAQTLGLWEDIQPRLKSAQGFVLSATAHAGSIHNLKLDNKVFLRVDETVYPAAARPMQHSTHHDTYLVFFPRYDMAGKPLFEHKSGTFDIIVNDVGDGLPQHTITFPYPLPVVGDTQPGILQVVMVIGAAMAALLVNCTSCLVGSLTVGSLSMGTAAGTGGGAVTLGMRAALTRRTLWYLASLSAMYLAVAIAFYSLEMETSALRPLELVGGLVLVAIGASFLRGSLPGAWLEGRIVRPFWAKLTGVQPPVGSAAGGVALSGGASTAMGVSLAVVCSVAGAPTLTTATLLPLLVYAGLSSPVWAFVILGTYLAISALPFFFVAVGLGELLLRASERLRSTLVLANAALLITLGLVLIISPSAIADMVSAPVRMILLPLRSLL